MGLKGLSSRKLCKLVDSPRLGIDMRCLQALISFIIL